MRYSTFLVQSSRLLLFVSIAAAALSVSPNQQGYLPDCGGGVFEFDSVFYRVGLISAIPPCDLKAQAMQESSLNPDAESPAGAIGIAQFMPRTWEWLIQKYDLPDWDMRNPVHSIAMQGIYMTYLLERCGDDTNKWECALASYNAGEGRVLKAIKMVGRLGWSAVQAQLPLETVHYSRAIMQRAKELRR